MVCVQVDQALRCLKEGSATTKDTKVKGQVSATSKGVGEGECGRLKLR